MKKSLTFVLAALLLCACTGNQAHRDCDRKLVPINAATQTDRSEGDSVSDVDSDPRRHPHPIHSDDTHPE